MPLATRFLVVLLASGASALTSAGAVARAHTLRSPAPFMSVDTARKYLRAEFWNKESATLLELINVLGRWETPDDWKERKFFSTVTNDRVASFANAATKERYEMAQKLGVVERVAMQQNVPNLPFSNAALAASVGKTVADFEAMPVTRAAVNVVFDALMESKSGLIAPDLLLKRRASLMNDEGGLDEAAFARALYKGRVLVVISWFFLGKGQVLGGLFGLKVLFDSLDIWEKLDVPVLDYLFWPAALAATFYAATDDSFDVDYELKPDPDCDAQESTSVAGSLEVVTSQTGQTDQ